MNQNNQEPKTGRKRRSHSDGLPNPPHNFVELISIVIGILREYGARPDGLTVADLEKIKQDQLTESAADKDAEGVYKAEHQSFRLGQASRLGAVEHEVDVLRAKYKKDPVVRARLKPVKFRKGGRKASHQEPPPAPENGGEKPGGPAPETPGPDHTK